MEIYTYPDAQVLDVALTQIEAGVKDNLHFKVQRRTKSILKETIDYVVWEAVHDIILEIYDRNTNEPIA